MSSSPNSLDWAHWKVFTIGSAGSLGDGSSCVWRPKIAYISYFKRFLVLCQF